MPNKYLTAFENALANYVNQTKRSHFSFPSDEKRLFKPDFFGYFLHSKTCYPALEKLQSKLKGVGEEEARTLIQCHFMDKQNKWNTYSFNSYFLDEIYTIETTNDWKENWAIFDKNPIGYYQGILFRGSTEDIAYCFKNGIKESETSDFLDDYIQDMNGAIGVSTTKSFVVAKGYALPAINPRNEVILATKPIATEAYIYVINFTKNTAIDLEATFILKGNSDSAKRSANKKEVNIVGSIASEEILGAFYVNRAGKIKWHLNPYRKETPDYSHFESLLPKEFYNELIQEKKKLPSSSSEPATMSPVHSTSPN